MQSPRERSDAIEFCVALHQAPEGQHIGQATVITKQTSTTGNGSSTRCATGQARLTQTDCGTHTHTQTGASKQVVVVAASVAHSFVRSPARPPLVYLSKLTNFGQRIIINIKTLRRLHAAGAECETESDRKRQRGGEKEREAGTMQLVGRTRSGPLADWAGQFP